MINMDIQELLAKVFSISNDKEYKVKFFNENEITIDKEKKLTYLQLGTELINNHSVIKEVHIIYSDKY